MASASGLFAPLTAALALETAVVVFLSQIRSQALHGVQTEGKQKEAQRCVVLGAGLLRLPGRAAFFGLRPFPPTVWLLITAAQE